MKYQLPKNLNTTGRVIRLSIGLLLLIYAYWQSSWIALVFSVFTLFEAYMSWCVIYHILGKTSCPIKKTGKKHTTRR